MSVWRVVRGLLHLLVGLLATALITGIGAWIWPDASRWIWLIGYAVMLVLVLKEMLDLLRTKSGK